MKRIWSRFRESVTNPAWVTLPCFFRVLKKTKSPGFNSSMVTLLPSLLCSVDVLGMYTSMTSKLRISSPEQSIPKTVEPPYLYGVPMYDLALVMTISVFSSRDTRVLEHEVNVSKRKMAIK
jgi:hypothetical protein